MKNNIQRLIQDYITANPDNSDASELSRISQIAGDASACAAINDIAKDTSQIWQLLALCRDAEFVMQSFHKVMGEDRRQRARLQRHRESIEDLRHFIDEVTEWCDEPLTAWLPIREKSAAYYRKALDRMAALIEDRQLVFDDTKLMLLSVTRKSATTTAAENSAIGWLAIEVMDAFSKPFTKQVATLAEVALGIGEVSQERVREARRQRARKSI